MTPVEDMSCSEGMCAWWHSGKGECAFLVIAIETRRVMNEFIPEKKERKTDIPVREKKERKTDIPVRL